MATASTVIENGRAKAYRPLPSARRRAALAQALAAYGRGDFFLAHELLEPAWMGARDPAERALYSGLIKLAAAHVHAVRGNSLGAAKNLEGARVRLDRVPRASMSGVDVEATREAIGTALAAIGANAPGAAILDPPIRITLDTVRPPA